MIEILNFDYSSNPFYYELNYCILLLWNLLFKSNKIGIMITGNSIEALILYAETRIEIVYKERITKNIL